MDFKNNILGAVGNTPLVRLNKVVPPGSATVLVKCEFMNPTGSIKDRMAVHILNEAEKAGKIKPVVFKTFPLAQAAEAHKLMETSQHIGKIVLTV